MKNSSKPAAHNNRLCFDYNLFIVCSVIFCDTNLENFANGASIMKEYNFESIEETEQQGLNTQETEVASEEKNNELFEFFEPVTASYVLGYN